MVERNLAKVDVAGSSPVSRSKQGRCKIVDGRLDRGSEPKAHAPERRRTSAPPGQSPACQPKSDHNSDIRRRLVSRSKQGRCKIVDGRLVDIRGGFGGKMVSRLIG